MGFPLDLLATAGMADATTLRGIAAVVGIIGVGAWAMSIRRKSLRDTAAAEGKPVYGYRGGADPDLPEDPWTHLTLAKIDRALFWFSCEEGVKGQDEAIEVLRDELYMARARLSGAASGISTKPKIVL